MPTTGRKEPRRAAGGRPEAPEPRRAEGGGGHKGAGRRRRLAEHGQPIKHAGTPGTT